MLINAGLVSVQLGAPVIFKQERLGLNGDMAVVGDRNIIETTKKNLDFSSVVTG